MLYPLRERYLPLRNIYKPVMEPKGELEDIDDGAGCAEIWEELSERRRSEEE
jgi:hypothetical protein